MLLEGKIAVIYGASGGIGSVVARAFASAGATVVLAGRTMEPLVALADAIHAAGGKAEPTPADALDSSAVARHVDAVVDRFGRIDVSFNLVGIAHRQGRPLVDIPVGEFADPIREYATTQFLTATAAARTMVPQGSGVILMLTTQPARLAIPLSGPFGAAMAMVEAFSRNLAAEVGPSGVRVACLLSTGSLDTPGVQGAIRRHAAASGISVAEFEADFAQHAVLKRSTLSRDVADVATFLASDRASSITATAVNISCGLIPG